VGAFDAGMSALQSSGFVDSLVRLKEENKPILGICLGMHLMTAGSEEGSLAGLGWFDTTVKKFDLDVQFRVPHMGWNTVKFKTISRLGISLESSPRFYFTHSYFVVSAGDAVMGETEYGKPFCSVLEDGNIFAVQFHPEKSHRFGLNILRNFANLNA
jgi:imidazole glycerol-phosphate synthase subunit HisH